MTVLPCPPGLPVCADDKANNGGPFCFVYTTLFKKVKLRFPFTRFERELLTELNIAAQHRRRPASSQQLGIRASVPSHVRPPGVASIGGCLLISLRSQAPRRPPVGKLEWDCWEVDPLHLPAIL